MPFLMRPAASPSAGLSSRGVTLPAVGGQAQVAGLLDRHPQAELTRVLGDEQLGVGVLLQRRGERLGVTQRRDHEGRAHTGVVHQDRGPHAADGRGLDEPLLVHGDRLGSAREQRVDHGPDVVVVDDVVVRVGTVVGRRGVVRQGDRRHRCRSRAPGRPACSSGRVARSTTMRVPAVSAARRSSPDTCRRSSRMVSSSERFFSLDVGDDLDQLGVPILADDGRRRADVGLVGEDGQETKDEREHGQRQIVRAGGAQEIPQLPSHQRARRIP